MVLLMRQKSGDYQAGIMPKDFPDDCLGENSMI
jgi:hypothetical protein